MADGVDITPGAGKTIATDETGVGHMQFVKLAQSADGSSTPITANSSGLATNDPEAIGVLNEILISIMNVLGRTGYFDPTLGSQRVSVANTPAVTISSGTVTTVTTTATVTTLNQMSAISTIYDQYAQMNSCVFALRDRISVT